MAQITNFLANKYFNYVANPKLVLITHVMMFRPGDDFMQDGRADSGQGDDDNLVLIDFLSTPQVLEHQADRVRALDDLHAHVDQHPVLRLQLEHAGHDDD